MHPQIAALLEQAEDRYLQPKEIELFRRYAASLAQRLQTYEFLREQEESIFQWVADKLVEALPSEKQEILERALKHWLLIVRYCATAMLINDAEFLDRRLNDWVKGLVETYQTQAIDRQLYSLLNKRLEEVLSSQQLALIQPVLAKAEATLLSD